MRVVALVRITVVAFLLAFAGGVSADVVVYSQGFEANDGSYVAANTTGDVQWQWGTPTNVGPPGAHSGLKCWGTNLSGNISVTSVGTLTSPAIPVPAVTATETVRLSFWLWSDMSGMYDRGEFRTSSDGTTWTTVIMFYEKMASGWQRYEFDVRQYAGGNLHLQMYVDKVYDPATPGFYLDDIAMTVRTKPATTATLQVVGYEDPASYASCPWVYTWDGQGYAKDNDIYSVARYPRGEYTDSYLLRTPLVARDGRYGIEVREVESEDSWTDMTALVAVDHDAGVGIGPDQAGVVHAYRQDALAAPGSATAAGRNVSPLLATRDNSGLPAYDGDTVSLGFGRVDAAAGAHLILRVKGFVTGTGTPKPMTGPPAVVVEVEDASGAFVEAGRLLPRFDWSEQVFDLAPLLSAGRDLNVRLRSISHGTKYHEIDYVALAAGTEPSFSATPQRLVQALARGNDVLPVLGAVDGTRLAMSPGDSFSLSFLETPRAGAARDFIFVSRGYYVPRGGSFLVYVWNGTEWSQVDAKSGTTGADETWNFDLSLFLPDPAGEFKVRIWQDYINEEARIDFVGLTVGVTPGTLSVASDLRGGGTVDIRTQVSLVDQVYITYGYGNRDRWSEYRWTGIVTKLPPTTNPVTVTGSTIGWTYADPNIPVLAQDSYYVEVWTGAGGSGTIMWNPAMGTGTGTSVAYAGTPLTAGTTYYARVRASNGVLWGGWSEVSFVAAASAPTTIGISPGVGPVAGGTSVTITGTNLSGATSVTFDGVAGTITANTATSITVTTPLHVVGTVDVVVTTPSGSTTLRLAFSYLDAAAIPTLSGWMLGLLAATLAGVGFLTLRV